MKRYSMTALSVAAILFACDVAIPARAQGETLKLAAPGDAGMDADRLGQIDEIINRRVKNRESIGVSVLISKRDSVVYFKQFGHRDAESMRPMEQDTIFRIYSMTKAITSAAILVLHDDGKLSLDDPLDKHLPELADRTIFAPKGNRRATSQPKLRHLLSHTAGYTYGRKDGTAIQRKYFDADLLDRDCERHDWIDKVSRLPLVSDPGTQWEYGISTDILGAVIERVSGNTLADFLQARIFGPLQMTDTGFHVPANKLHRFAACYERKSDDWTLQDSPTKSRYSGRAKFQSGGGGLVSTASDYWKFLAMIRRGGEFRGVRVLREESVRLMTENQLDFKTDWTSGWGYGFRVIVEPVPSAESHLLSECISAGRASTTSCINRRENLTVIVLEQVIPYTDQNFVDVHKLAYDAIH